MLTYQECLELSELSADEIDAIAQHEHVPEIVAAELGNYLVHCPDGVPRLRRIILDDIAEAKHRGDRQRALHLRLVLRHFVETHPLKAASASEPGHAVTPPATGATQRLNRSSLQ